MAKRQGLGRGLDALLGGIVEDAAPAAEKAASAAQPEREQAGDAVVTLRLSDIDPNRDQPRRRFDETALQELADSIKAVGVIQPILVRKEDGRYTIIAGERRWRASRLAGLDEIPAIVRDWDEVKRLEAALIENLQRDDLNPVEEAMGVSKLMEQCGLTQEQAAERLGKSRPAVANLIRLLTLPESILNMLREGKLSAGHARALVPLTKELQLRLAQLAAAQGWSVRQLERICAQQNTEKKPVKAQRPKDPEFKRLERMARDVFGTRAELSGDEQKGKLVVHYQTAEDLQRIWDLLEFIQQNEV
ncbi:MAG: ParB/RepB/Spo0J family partition protein [Clostridia bacterium]|nr:ParB/RepB/Spo0J family partition protein [Clostridia bacterium]